jgi:hypothetical protein
VLPRDARRCQSSEQCAAADSEQGGQFTDRLPLVVKPQQALLLGRVKLHGLGGGQATCDPSLPEGGAALLSLIGHKPRPIQAHQRTTTALLPPTQRTASTTRPLSMWAVNPLAHCMSYTEPVTGEYASTTGPY